MGRSTRSSTGQRHGTHPFALPAGSAVTFRGTFAAIDSDSDRLTSVGGVAVTHDANGNLTSDAQGNRYEYDLENRLKKVSQGDGTVIEHVYDPDGNLVRKSTTRPGQQPDIVDYLVDTSGPIPQVVMETDGVTGAPRAAYVRGDGGDLLSILRPSAPGGYDTLYVHSDFLGSVRALTDDAGTVTDRYEYTTSGELVSHTGTDPQPYGFAGEARDPDTGLSYNRARWFSPDFGRFLSMDTFAGRQDEPLSLHKYLYAGADPGNKTDPTGHDFSLSVSLTSLAVSNTIAAISLPNVQAMLATTHHLELIPVQIRDRAWTGGPTRPGFPFAGWDG